MNTTRKRKRDRRDVPKQPKENSSTSIAYHIEEATVHLHALYHYYGAKLSPEELSFLAKTKKNLKVLHNRHSK